MSTTPSGDQHSKTTRANNNFDGECSWDDDDFHVPVPRLEAKVEQAAPVDVKKGDAITSFVEHRPPATELKADDDWLTDLGSARISAHGYSKADPQQLRGADKEPSSQALSSLNTPAAKKKRRCVICTRPVAVNDDLSCRHCVKCLPKA